MSLPDPLKLSLVEALQVSARNSRDYQGRKEDVFRAALDLEVVRKVFARATKLGEKCRTIGWIDRAPKRKDPPEVLLAQRGGASA